MFSFIVIDNQGKLITLSGPPNIASSLTLLKVKTLVLCHVKTINMTETWNLFCSCDQLSFCVLNNKKYTF